MPGLSGMIPGGPLQGIVFLGLRPSGLQVRKSLPEDVGGAARILLYPVTDVVLLGWP
jgi:hypothetical protein